MSQKRRFIVSFFLSIVFLIFSYWVTNLRLPLSGEGVLLSRIELLREILLPRPTTVADSVLFVNVTYDRDLRPAKDQYQFPAGRAPITDRQKLLKLLRYLKETNSYRYVLLDVFFGDNYETEYDKELYAVIDSMPRIVIPYHEGYNLATAKLMKKSGVADYSTTFFKSSFAKYPYYNDTLKSMPVKMYEDIMHRSIDKHGIFYTDGGRLVRKSIVLTFDMKADKAYADNGDKIWYNLGMDLLDDSIPEYKTKGNNLLFKDPMLTDGKYIVIGSFDGDDTHSTFMGKLSGAVLNFNAFISLMNNRHVVSLTLIYVLFFVFWCMSYLTISRQNIQELLKNSLDSNKGKKARILILALSFICSWIGYSLLMTIICISTYFILGEVYDIFITSTFFYLLSLIVTRLHEHNICF